MCCDLANGGRHEAGEALIESGVFCGGVSAPTGPHTLQLACIKKIMKRFVGETVYGGDRLITSEVPVVFFQAIAEFKCCPGRPCCLDCAQHQPVRRPHPGRHSGQHGVRRAL